MTKNKALLGAYAKGESAARNGLDRLACPYTVAPHGCHRRNGGTWGGVFRSYWLRGWADWHSRQESNLRPSS